MSFHIEGFSAAWCQCGGGEKQQEEGGEQGVKRVGLGCGEGVQIGHNTRLFVFCLIFIKLNIKELEGRQFVRISVVFKFARRPWKYEVGQT